MSEDLTLAGEGKNLLCLDHWSMAGMKFLPPWLPDTAMPGRSNARVYTAQISPGEQTLFHRHKHNTLYVTVGPRPSPTLAYHSPVNGQISKARGRAGMANSSVQPAHASGVSLTRFVTCFCLATSWMRSSMTGRGLNFRTRW